MVTYPEENNAQAAVDKNGRIRNKGMYIGSLDDLSPSEAWIVHHAVSAFTRKDMFWPSIKKLARMARCSVATVHRALPKLEGKYLQIERRPGRSNIYRPSVYLLDKLRLKDF
jgi:hypothetical protein